MSVLPIADEGIYPGVTVDIDSKIILQGSFVNPPAAMVVVYEIVDSANYVVLSGSPSAVTSNPIAGGYMIRAQATALLPNNLEEGLDYTLFWKVTYQDPGNAANALGVTSMESFQVLSREKMEEGLRHGVALDFNKIPAQAVVRPKSPAIGSNDLKVRVFTPDNIKTVLVEGLTPTVSGGTLILNEEIDVTNMYSVKNGETISFIVNPTWVGNNGYTLPGSATVYPFEPGTNIRIRYLPSLNPYMLHWYYNDDTMIGTSQSWVINNQISIAMHEMKASMERAMRYPGLIESAFTNADYVQFLKMGRDLFNSIGVLTNFDMTGADGQMYAWWLMCAKYEAAASRELEEAIKAFDFSGLSTSLNVDISQAYDNLKQTLWSQIESVIIPAKQRLAAKGVTTGNGSAANLMSGRVPFAVGVTYSQVGNARFLYYGHAFGGLIGSYIGRYA